MSRKVGNNTNFNRAMLPMGPSPFEFNMDDGNCAVEWRNWLRGFELFARASGIDDQATKVDWLLHCAGPKVQQVYFNLPDQNNTQRKGPLASNYVLSNDKYYEAVDKLENYFAPKRNISYERHVFRKILRGKNERIDSMIMRLRTQADRCQFDDQLDENIKEQITIGCNSDLLQRKMLERGDRTLDEIIKIARIHEAVSDQQKNFANEKQNENVPQKTTEEVCKIETLRPSYKRKLNFSNFKRVDSQTGECSRCGFRDHKRSYERCPAKGKQCNRCGKMDHFGRKCFTKDVDRNDDHEIPNKRKESIHMIRATKPSSKINRASSLMQTTRDESVQMIRGTTGSPDEYDDIFCIFTKNDAANRIWSKIGGVEVQVVVDSGTRYNIVDRDTWTELKAKKIDLIWSQREIDIGFNAYGGHQLKFLGMFEAVIQIGGKQAKAKFYVADEIGKFLIGWETAIFLNVLKIGNDVNNDEETPKQELSTIKGILVEIPINADVKAVQQPYRRVPAPLEKIVDGKIAELLKQGIIEKVETSRWISLGFAFLFSLAYSLPLQIRDKLPSLRESIIDDQEVRDKDKESKSKGKEYANEKRNAKQSEIMEGDEVILKRQVIPNKLATTFEPTVYKVKRRNGSEILVENTETSAKYRRNVAHAKKVFKEGSEEETATTMNSDSASTSNASRNSETIQTDGIVQRVPVGPEELILQVPTPIEMKRNRSMPKKYSDYVVSNLKGVMKQKKKRVVVASAIIERHLWCHHCKYDCQ